MRWGEIAQIMCAKGHSARYYVQPSHGRGWHATEKDEATQMLTANEIFFGPTGCDDARRWCEQRNAQRAGSAQAGKGE